jgi:hypothetical protein
MRAGYAGGWRLFASLGRQGPRMRVVMSVSAASYLQGGSSGTHSASEGEPLSCSVYW